MFAAKPAFGTWSRRAPNYGYGYLTLLVITLAPPLWHAFMKPKLAIWDRDFATPAERAIAEEHNRRSG